MVFELSLRISASPALPDAPFRNATLEALLVHLRLLDDFFGSPDQCLPPRKRESDDVFARHWLPSWQPRPFFRPVERSRANAQIVHLAARRRMGYRWTQLPQVVTRCALTADAFIGQLEQSHSRRAKAFIASRLLVDRFLAGPLVVPLRRR